MPEGCGAIAAASSARLWRRDGAHLRQDERPVHEEAWDRRTRITPKYAYVPNHLQLADAAAPEISEAWQNGTTATAMPASRQAAEIRDSPDGSAAAGDVGIAQR